MEDYKNAIRVRCGITIVDSVGASQDRAGTTITRIKIKFVPATAANPEYILNKYQKIISQVSGIHGIKFIPKTLEQVSSTGQD